MKTVMSLSSLAVAALLACTTASAETAQQAPAAPAAATPSAAATMPTKPAAPVEAAAPAAQPAVAAATETAKPAMHKATMSHRKVEEIQAALKNAGESVEIDGRWNANTRDALADFQSKHGLKVTHRFDHQTAKVLKVPTWTS